MEENQVRENIEDYRFSLKRIFLVLKDIFGGEYNDKDNKILEEVAKIKAQESPRIQELYNNLENHQTTIKKTRRTTKPNINKSAEIEMNRKIAKEKSISEKKEEIQEI